MTKLEIATLGGGCFWCLEGVFQNLVGVTSVLSGYSGGTVEQPTYEQVCTGDTGHAEVVQVQFDPSAIHYAELLEVFFAVHDPTTKNRQGADIGTQYRSVIFYHDQDQKCIATEVITKAQELWEKPIVTQLEPISKFYPAESYHHDYFSLNPNQSYCKLVIEPKVAKFRKQFASRISI